MSLTRHLEKNAREDGIKNPADIYDQPTFEQIEADIKSCKSNVTELLSAESSATSSHENVRCLEETRSFCADLTEEFREHFLALIKQYRTERRPIAQPIVDFLLEKQLVIPTFTIAGGADARALLQEFNLGVTVAEDALVLAFQLPKPLAQFWWKGGVYTGSETAVDVEGTVIEWGIFYRELMSVAWGVQGYYENEKNLMFRRLNDVGQHDPQKYYYVWEMETWG